jgi:hypothetical protein
MSQADVEVVERGLDYNLRSLLLLYVVVCTFNFNIVALARGIQLAG